MGRVLACQLPFLLLASFKVDTMGDDPSDFFASVSLAVVTGWLEGLSVRWVSRAHQAGVLT